MLRDMVLGLLAAAQPAAEMPMVTEARAFMDDYARDLIAGDRAAIAARYQRRGAWRLGEGGGEFDSYARIVAGYAGPRWGPPRRFEWQDLRYRQAGPDTVQVTGRFAWTPADGRPRPFSYSALLVREEGVLRIRLEDERPLGR
jgi:hypothetical protein